MRLVTIVLTATLLLAAACSSNSGSSGSKLSVVATTTQIGDFARNVGGDHIALTVLLKPNQDAHDFEPQPSQIRALSESKLVLRHGIGLDVYVDKAVSQGGARVVAVTDGIKLQAPPEGTDIEGADPHVWFAVDNARRMVQNIRDALVAADPPNASVYTDNATKYLASLDALDTKLKGLVAEIPTSCRKLVTNHDVLGYYSQAYGFKLVGAIIPSTSTEAKASAADVAGIVRKIRTENVPAIFAEASVNPALIKQVAKEANVKVVSDLYGDSLGPKNSDGATYVAMMETNTKKIATALKACKA